MQALAQLLSQVIYTPKLAFALHTAEVYSHFRAILNCLSPEDYDLVLINPDDELRALVANLPCAVYELPDLLPDLLQVTGQNFGQFKSRGYRYLVSHHYHGMMKLHLSENPEDSLYYPLLKVLGQYNIRLMYGLGHDPWNLADWNRFYDLHLCFGPWQVERLAAFPESIKLEVGVPRYSDYFKQAQDPSLRLALRQKHGLKAEDRVLVWLPTLGPENTVPIYLPIIQSLMQTSGDKFCLRIKPHPLSWQQEPDKLKDLADLPPEWVINTPCDNQELFLIADYILCDYGGVAFSAVYTDQNLILLNHPDKVLAEDESDALLRQALPALSPQHSDELRALLNNSQHWQTQAVQRATLHKRFFRPYGAQSANMAAKILSNLADYLP